MDTIVSLGNYTLQKFPRSFMLTIPKNWVESNKLKKGSKLSVSVSNEGELLIKPVEIIEEVKNE